MNITATRVDDANLIIGGTITNESINKEIDKLAKQASKELNIDGFRKGKAPVSAVKKLHGEKLKEDAKGGLINLLIDKGLKDAEISGTDVLGEPRFSKYDEKDTDINVEVEISIRPNVDVTGYEDIIPSYEKPEVTDAEVQEKLAQLANEQAPFEAIAKPKKVENGDMTVIDFEGFLNDEPFDGGKGEKMNLKIGSGQFIPGFESQLIGMEYGEERTIDITFPAEYQSKDLAGQKTKFVVKLHEIQSQKEGTIDDELAKKVLQGEEDASLELLTKKVTAQVESGKVSKLYNEDLKPRLIEALVSKIDFALPKNIVEQEIDARVNAKAKDMSEEEINALKEDTSKVNELRDAVKDEAKDSVKATFIVDALAKIKNITVEDNEVSQALYYEAMMQGQNPQDLVKYYEDNGLLPAVKMGMIEDKLFGNLLGIEG